MDPATAVEAEALSRHRDQIQAMYQAIERGDSNIQKFYENSVLFITGGSGFLGKLLLEKLFRTCKIKKAYVLIRSKKEKSGRERLSDVFNDPLFDSLKSRKPLFAESVVPVNGDIADLNLGMSDLDWHQVANEANIIFHMAATTRFNENLKTSTLVNVRATREVIALARECKALRSFIHVSTAYAHATHTSAEVLDKFYQTPIDPELLIKMAESFDADQMDSMLKCLIKDWINSYTFTKAVGEEVVRREAGHLPVCVVRPGVVIATQWDPMPGWLDISCAYSATGLLIGPGVGLVRVLLYKPEVPVGLIPGDLANNAIIAAGWKASSLTNDDPAIIYTLSSSNNPVTIGMIVNRGMEIGSLYPTPRAIWYINIICAETQFVYRILSFLLHRIPGAIADLGCMLIGREKPFMKINEKIDSYVDLFGVFLSQGWTFDNSGIEKLSNELSKSDRLMFDIDVRKVNWTEYVPTWCMGVRRYIIKDGLRGTEFARKKQFFFRIANFLVALLYLYCFYKVICVVYYFAF